MFNRGNVERRKPSSENMTHIPMPIRTETKKGANILRRHNQTVIPISLCCCCFVLLIIIGVWSLVPSSTTPTVSNATGACDGYDGVLYISQGDAEGAAGTIFFLFVLNQLQYADRYNLIPWVHLSNVSKYVYDPQVHGFSPPTTFTMFNGVNVSWVQYIDPTDQQRYPFPGKPVQVQSPLTKQTITVYGTGVWNSYFHSVSHFSPHDLSCRNKPLIQFTHRQIIPALHVHCPWSLRAWRYGGLPPGLRQAKLKYDDWLAPMRQRGNALVQKYIRVRSHIQNLADQANPSAHCLAVHIRHSDKANRRKRIPVRTFLRYVQAYVEYQIGQQPSPFSVFVATDSSKVLDEMESTWPANVLTHIRSQGSHVVRSNNTTAVFAMGVSHHLTNTQVLVDIVAMSKCQFLLHGFSAVSEAVHYLNPNLHRQSVNLEVAKPKSILKFRDMLF